MGEPLREGEYAVRVVAVSDLPQSAEGGSVVRARPIWQLGVDVVDIGPRADQAPKVDGHLRHVLRGMPLTRAVCRDVDLHCAEGRAVREGRGADVDPTDRSAEPIEEQIHA